MDLNVGIFSPMFSEVNGTAKATRTLSFALAKQGVNVHVYAPKCSFFKTNQSNLNFHDLKSLKIRTDPEVFMSFTMLQSFKPKKFKHLDVTHAMSVLSAGVLGLSASKHMEIPKVITHHSPLSFYVDEFVPIVGSVLKRILPKAERFMYNRWDLVSTPTISKKQLLHEWGYKEPIIAISNGIENKYFKKVDPTAVRDKYKLGDKKILVYASRMSKEKNIKKVVHSFRNIHKRFPDSHLVLVGSGPELKPIAHLIRKEKMEDIVTQTGFVHFNELIQWYRTADITCIWSYVEAQGLVILESMAQGTPTVGTNANGIKNVITNGKTGLLADGLKDFENKIVELFENDELREEMSKNCLNYIQAHRIENVAKNWIKIYKKLIDFYPITDNLEFQKIYQSFWKVFAKNNDGIEY